MFQIGDHVKIRNSEIYGIVEHILENVCCVFSINGNKIHWVNFENLEKVCKSGE